MRRTIISSAILIAVIALLSCKGGYSDSSGGDNDGTGGAGSGGDSAKAITAFSFAAAQNGVLSADAAGVISGTTISVTVPHGTTSVTSLVATFTTTGKLVSVEGAAQTSGTTANDFSSAKTYTVTAADGSTQNYTVTVTVAAASAKEITAFSFPAVTWTGDKTGNAYGTTISGTSITAKLPYGSTTMVASFATTGASVSVGGITQTSGVTSNDFKNPVTYRVTAADGSTEDYTVTVLFAPAVNSLSNTLQGATLSSYWKIDSAGVYFADSIGLSLRCDAVSAVSDNFTITIRLMTTGEVYGTNYLSPWDLQSKSSIATVSQDVNYIKIVGPLNEIQRLIAFLELLPPQPYYPYTIHDTACDAEVYILLTDKNGLSALGRVVYNFQPQ